MLCDICVRCYSFSDQYKIKDFSSRGGKISGPHWLFFISPGILILFKTSHGHMHTHGQLYSCPTYKNTIFLGLGLVKTLSRPSAVARTG